MKRANVWRRLQPARARVSDLKPSAQVCTDTEFDEFMAVALQSGLDPMRRQITPLILQPDGCLACSTALVDVEFDHIIPLGLGGFNEPDNWAALCPDCHRRKTVNDLRAIAKPSGNAAIMKQAGSGRHLVAMGLIRPGGVISTLR